MASLYNTQPLRDAIDSRLRAEEEVRRQIVLAHQNGLSLRDIATSTGMSHETVRRILAREVSL